MTFNPLFAVVIQFGETDGGGVSIVDSKWLTPRRREVLPVKGSKTFDRILLRDKTPDDKWKLYGVHVRIFCETNNINEAKRKLKLSETTSDLEIEETEVVGKRHGKRKIYSSDEDEVDQFVRPPSLKKDLTKIEAKLAIKAYQLKVLALLAIIKTQNNQILYLLKQNKTRERGVLPNVFKFPLSTEEELNLIEDLLNNKENYDNLVS